MSGEESQKRTHQITPEQARELKIGRSLCMDYHGETICMSLLPNSGELEVEDGQCSDCQWDVETTGMAYFGSLDWKSVIKWGADGDPQWETRDSDCWEYFVACPCCEKRCRGIDFAGDISEKDVANCYISGKMSLDRLEQSLEVLMDE